MAADKGVAAPVLKFWVLQYTMLNLSEARLLARNVRTLVDPPSRRYVLYSVN